MAKIIEYLIEKLDANILFISHVIIPTSNIPEDRFVVRKVLDILNNKNKANIICNDYTPEELKGIIGQCDLFIGARMHANIAALSMFIPTLAIAYSHKSYGIMQMIGVEDYVCDFKNMNYKDLCNYSAWVKQHQ